MRVFKRIAVAALLLGLAAPAAAEIEINEPWVRAAPPTAKMLAGYAVLANEGESKRHVVAASSPAFEAIELHRTVEEDGVARMIQQDRFTIPADGSLALEPGSYHLMLMRPHEAVEPGDEVEITLEFEDGEEREVTFPVRRQGGGHHDGGEHQQH
ncbi:MAG: copper chaperone PCu(A)C [Thiohalospira sp.]